MQLLAKSGARATMCEYDDQGNITDIAFRLPIEGQLVSFQLPCDPIPVLAILKQDKKVPMAKKTMETARNVAWRIVKDWTEAQLAIIETGMVAPEQVFLPYAISGNGKTVYELFKDGSANLLVAQNNPNVEGFGGDKQ